MFSGYLTEYSRGCLPIKEVIEKWGNRSSVRTLSTMISVIVEGKEDAKEIIL